MMKRVLAFTIALLSLCSCSIMKSTQGDCRYYSLTVFQTSDNHYAETGDETYSYGLAKDANWNVYRVVTYRPGDDYKNNMYDGKNVSGRYVFIGTYTYETSDERIKTVPCLISKDSYDYINKHYGEFADRLLKIFTN